ncbi:hypothetical protein AURDEDRAFT_153825 [Auricularia subglabra TFB-10046 SS5]|nr:hypothetical protein AURDEDRAFT_153825 [Auricularia subglabra TFB-10046 SS5]
MLAASQGPPAVHLDLDHELVTQLYHHISWILSEFLRYACNLFQTACYALYCYDHLLVLSDEVQRVWRKPLALPSLLYILQRYLTHVGLVIMQLALHKRDWATDLCARVVQLPGAFIIISFALTATVSMLRMCAMYWKNNVLLFCLASVFIGQIVIMGVCLSTGTRYPFIDGCVITSAASYFGAFWAAPLASDALLLSLGLYRVYNYRRFRIRSTLAEQLLRDGVPYLFAVFCAKLLCVMAFYTAPDDLRELGAAFALALTSLLVARLQLSLGDRDHDPQAENIHRLFFNADQEDNEGCKGPLARFFSLSNLGEQIPPQVKYNTGRPSIAGYGL